MPPWLLPWPGCASTPSPPSPGWSRAAGPTKPIAALAPLPEGVVKSSLTNFALAVVDRGS